MAKRFILVHDRGFKPEKEAFERIWSEAIAHGLECDRGAYARFRFESCVRDFAYYGETSNEFLSGRRDPYDREADIADRRIFNLAIRDGKSNPHHGAGYLIHPTVIEAIAD